MPGFAALLGLSRVSETVQVWLGVSSSDAPTVGGFLYLTIASVAAGLTASTVRWALVDTLHHRTGIPPPSWDFSRLGQNIAAFETLIEIHYRYYQFYANMLIAVVFVGIVQIRLGGSIEPWPHAALGGVAVLFYFASRDTLRKYYQRTGMLLGAPKVRPRKSLKDRPAANGATSD